MYRNTLRLSVRHDQSNELRVIVALAGAVNAERYERPTQLALIEDGVRIAAGEGVAELVVEGWPSAASLIADANSAGIVSFGCLDCATARGVSSEGHSPFDSLEWVPGSDVRLPLHACGAPRPSGKLLTIEAQRSGQQDFDKRVGKITIGADRGSDGSPSGPS